MTAPGQYLSHRIVQIGPQGGGVRDYARVLDERFGELGVDRVTIIASKSDHKLQAPPGFQFDRNDIVLLNFSAYDYGYRGLCFWLVNTLRRIRRERGIHAMATFFHELDDDSPPSRAGFYASFAHKYLCYQVQAMSDWVFTNNDFHVDRLKRFYRGRTRATMLPVCSNIGEPTTLPPYGQRQSKAVIFGTEYNRQRGLLAFGGAAGIERLPVTEVVEIGPGASVGQGIKGWRALGELPEREVSANMLEARFGLTTHRPRNLTKSGIFAAYAAHGCIPVVPPVPPAGETLPQGLVSGANVILLADLPRVAADRLPGISQAVHQWYAAHDSMQTAETIVAALADDAGPGDRGLPPPIHPVATQRKPEPALRGR